MTQEHPLDGEQFKAENVGGSGWRLRDWPAVSGEPLSQCEVENRPLGQWGVETVHSANAMLKTANVKLKTDLFLGVRISSNLPSLPSTLVNPSPTSVMSKNLPSQDAPSASRGNRLGSGRDADLFVSPELVHTVLQNAKTLMNTQGERIELSETDVRTIVKQSLLSLGKEGLLGFENNTRTLHNTKITDTLDNLDQSIASTRAALTATPPNHRFRTVHHNSLGILLRWRFSKTASLGDIDNAIYHGRQAIIAGPDGRTSPLFLSHLARSLCSRFTKSGEIADLDEAVRKGREADLETGDPYQATCSNNLGNILVTLFSTPKGTIADMEEAINCGVGSLKSLPASDSRQASFLQELASWLVTKFEKTAATVDLDKAVNYGLQAVDATPPDHPDRAARLKDLSVMYDLRFKRTGARGDLERASRYAREAASITSPENLDPSSQRRLSKGNDAELSVAPLASGLERVPPSNTPDWPDLQAIRVGNSPGLANLRNGTGRARMSQLLQGRVAIELKDDLDGERQLSHMCATCVNLNLKGEDFLPRPFNKPETARQERDVLFSRAFWAIKAEGECPLCKFIVYALSASCVKPLRWENLICTLYLQRFSSYYDHEQSHESFRFLTVEGHIYGKKDLECSADILPVESDFFQQSFNGRTVNPKISPTMIRRWIEQCEVIHGKSCTRFEFPSYEPVSSPLSGQHRFCQLRPSLYFIDSYFNCIVKNPPSDRYVALSYVWGKVKSIRLYRCTIEWLKRPGSLWISRYQLPAVINDAINLVADIGERYLWVDSLCIPQDDDDHKQAAINQMNLIYENAVLTIIAAEGTDATTGLPGVGARPRSQSQRCEVIGPRLRMIVPHSLEALDRSKWASRAWTFQEYFASPRRLIFINGQVVLKCSWDSPCREDIVSEYQIFGIHDYVYKLPRPKAELYGRAYLKLSGKVASNALGGLIEVYSKKELSYQSDILDGFAGLAGMIRNDCGVEVRYGLAWAAISNSFLWTLSNAPASRRQGFPSWSWCGWLGPVYTTAQGRWEGISAWTTKYAWIDWYIYDGNSQFTLVPQLRQQSPRNGHEPSTSTSQLPETEDSMSNLLAGMHKHFSPKKFTPDMELRGDPTEIVEDPSALTPQYMEFLRKNSIGDATTPLNTVATKDIGVDPHTPLENHTLYCRTLTTTGYMSPYNPDGEGGPAPYQYVHLYDLENRYLGVAEITHSDLLASLDEHRNATADSFSPRIKGIPMHIAILSGPSPTSIKMTRYHIWLGGQMDYLIRSGQFPRFYQVMLLMRRKPRSGKAAGACGIYERAGLGEIPVHVLENMDILEWEDILLQ